MAQVPVKISSPSNWRLKDIDQLLDQLTDEIPDDLWTAVRREPPPSLPPDLAYFGSSAWLAYQVQLAAQLQNDYRRFGAERSEAQNPFKSPCKNPGVKSYAH